MLITEYSIFAIIFSLNWDLISQLVFSKNNRAFATLVSNPILRISWIQVQKERQYRFSSSLEPIATLYFSCYYYYTVTEFGNHQFYFSSHSRNRQKIVKISLTVLTAPILLSHRVSGRDFNVNFDSVFTRSRRLLDFEESTYILLIKPKNVLAVVEELAVSIKSKFQLWHLHGVKNAFEFYWVFILVLTPLLKPIILVPLSYPCPRQFWISRPFLSSFCNIVLVKYSPVVSARIPTKCSSIPPVEEIQNLNIIDICSTRLTSLVQSSKKAVCLTLCIIASITDLDINVINSYWMPWLR